MKNYAFLHESSIYLFGWWSVTKVHSVYMGRIRFDGIGF